MSARAVLAAGALALGAGSACPDENPQDPAPTADEPRSDDGAPGPREKLGKLRAFGATLRIVMSAAPDAPHLLEVSYAFPDRGRWHLRPEEGRGRMIWYRYGTAAYSLGVSKEESVQLEGGARVDALQEIELRRAALLWPEAWTRTAAGAEVDLGPLGRLVAELEGDERPRAYHLFDGAGNRLRSLRVSAWRAIGERWYPARMSVRAPDESVLAEEELLEVDARVNFLEAFFLPPDRRAIVRERQAVLRARPIDLPVRSRRAFPLGDGAGWESALERAAEVHARWAELHTELAPWVALELDESARPVAIWLDLVDTWRLPPGWERSRAQPALALLAPGRPEGLRGRLAELRRVAGDDAQDAGAALYRFEPGRPESAELVLPLGKLH